MVRAWLVALAAAAPDAAAQTIQGSLIDVESNAPIPLGLVLMYTESGDSVTSTISDGAGRFRISAEEPGSFVLRAAALGYAETPAGVFDLGPNGAMTIEYRLRPEPLPIDALLVSIDRPVLEHHLVNNGFVRRLQRGLGKFITPYDIERSPARSTESLMEGIPSVRVAMVRNNVGGVGIPMPHLGETVQIAGPLGGWCEPTIYVDGLRTHYDPAAGFTLSQVASISDVDAIEIYRRPAEIPVEFSAGHQGPMTAIGLQNGNGCGVLVVWTKRGLAPGQRPSADLDRAEELDALQRSVVEGSVVAEAAPPEPGERVRLALSDELAARPGLSQLFEGTFVTLSGNAIVAEDAESGRAVSLPVEDVRAIQVRRLKGRGDAVRRGVIAGTVFGAGMWGFLELICATTCGARADQETALPALAAGAVIGAMVYSRGPGTEWVGTPVPAFSAGPAPGGFGVSFRIPM